MFKFNKNNPLPRSRQSSVDSPAHGSSPSTSISTATSAVDAWVSHGSDASSFRDMPSPEQRARVRSGKRSSVFNLRSRSNTTTSTTSSFVSLVHPSMPGSDPISPISPRDTRHLANQSFMDLPGPKRSLFRGKKGKRRSGQSSPNFDVAEIEEVESTSKRTSVLRRGRKMSEDTAHLKSRISIPFGFQHVTHTDRREYADLTGVRPGPGLHFQNFSSETLNSPPLTTASTPGLGSPPFNPDSSAESPKSVQSIRLTRSVESFSQPTSPRLHRSAQSAHQLPRSFSRPPLTRIADLPEEPCLPPVWVRSNRSSGFWDQFAPLSPPSVCDKLQSMTEEPSYVGNAVTTPDNSAVHTMSPLFTPDLGDVAEEPEYFTHSHTISANPPCFAHFSFDTSQRSPVSRPTSRRFSNPRGPITRPISQMSETRGSPPRNTSAWRAPNAAQRKSNTWRVIEESWEDDVDFIYDNALEADCDFDWDRTSERGAFDSDGQDDERPPTACSQSTSAPGVTPEDECTVQAKSLVGAFPPLLSSASIVTDLGPGFAVSTSAASGAQTLSDLFIPMHARPVSLAEGFSLTPSLLVPADFKEQISHEDMYDDLLADYECSDRHFPLMDAGLSVASSTRSSRVRSSKRSSYDSSLMSASQGSSSWNSIRRSASSSSSLPELIHSRHARRSFNRMVDRLSEQVASCASFNGDDEKEVEDDDTTPPGRQSHNLSFFASEEEELENQISRVVTEGGVRASLELARQGSTRSSRPSLHSRKYASSDGVSKLLAAQTPQAVKPRSRAASSSNAIRSHRQPYLSLFPAPPKNKRQPTTQS